MLHHASAAHASSGLGKVHLYSLTQMLDLAIYKFCTLFSPTIVSAATHTHHPTKHNHRIMTFPSMNETIFHFISCASMPLAFFRISFSMRSVFTSRLRRRSSARSSASKRSPLFSCACCLTPPLQILLARINHLGCLYNSVTVFCNQWYSFLFELLWIESSLSWFFHPSPR